MLAIGDLRARQTTLVRLEEARLKSVHTASSSAKDDKDKAIVAIPAPKSMPPVPYLLKDDATTAAKKKETALDKDEVVPKRKPWHKPELMMEGIGFQWMITHWGVIRGFGFIAMWQGGKGTS